VNDPEEPVVIERMRVLVRERIPGGYPVVLDDDPSAVAENRA
jgi:hypothetical protein